MGVTLEGKTISAICRQTGFDRKTIRGYVKKMILTARYPLQIKRLPF